MNQTVIKWLARAAMSYFVIWAIIYLGVIIQDDILRVTLQSLLTANIFAFILFLIENN